VYDHLEGRVERRGPAKLVVCVGGVGYEVAVPVGMDFGPDGAKEPRRVYVHLVVREDAHQLYGFPDRDACAWFRGLLGVRGVGPALALGILSALAPARLLAAIVENDPLPLVGVKGGGRKTAEQILLDLRDKAPRLAAEVELVPVAGPRRSAAVLDAVQALVSIGYREKEAEKSVAAAAQEVGEDDLETLVRTAISG
jgi:Holliday junction DNA helicase RuvA